MFVTLKDGTHAEITQAEAERISLQISFDEKELARVALAEKYGREAAGCSDVVDAVVSCWRDNRDRDGYKNALIRAVNEVSLASLMTDEDAMVKAVVAGAHGKDVAACKELVDAIKSYWLEHRETDGYEEALVDAVEQINVVHFTVR